MPKSGVERYCSALQVLAAGSAPLVADGRCTDHGKRNAGCKSWCRPTKRPAVSLSPSGPRHRIHCGCRHCPRCGTHPSVICYPSCWVSATSSGSPNPPRPGCRDRRNDSGRPRSDQRPRHQQRWSLTGRGALFRRCGVGGRYHDIRRNSHHNRRERALRRGGRGPRLRQCGGVDIG